MAKGIISWHGLMLGSFLWTQPHLAGQALHELADTPGVTRVAEAPYVGDRPTVNLDPAHVQQMVEQSVGLPGSGEQVYAAEPGLEQQAAEMQHQKAVDDLADNVAEGIGEVIEAQSRREEPEEAAESMQKLLDTERVARDFDQKERELGAKQKQEVTTTELKLKGGRQGIEEAYKDAPSEVRDQHLQRFDEVAKQVRDEQQANHAAQREQLGAERQQEIDRVQAQQPQGPQQQAPQPQPPPPQPPPPQDLDLYR